MRPPAADYWERRAALEDADVPDCTKLGPTRTHRTRTARRLPCGHDVPAGTVYEVEAWVVDGEFQTDCRCARCYDELMR